MERQKNRIKKEIQELSENPIEGVKLIMNENDMNLWVGEINGPIGTPYEGFVLKTTIKLTNQYPFESPSVTFDHPVFHPNINLGNGRICLDILNSQWCPAYSLTKVMLSISSLLDDPNANSPLNGEAAKYWRENREKYNEMAKSVCEKNCRKI